MKFSGFAIDLLSSIPSVLAAENPHAREEPEVVYAVLVPACGQTVRTPAKRIVRPETF